MSAAPTPSARAWWDDLWRYAVCGAGATATDYAVWWLLVARADWPAWAALLVSRPAGGVASFAGNRWWTWRHRREFDFARQFRRFWIVWAAGYVIAVVTIFAWGRALPNDRLLSKIAADLTAALIGFALQRAFTFR